MRTATIETTHDDAAVVAASLAPDNTSEMETTVDGDRVRTRIERETTSGLQSTVDDYVVNVGVAQRVVQTANQQTTTNT
jgi:tRNA threonylcarbamoyladenosine modification (KEOPS) complex  Pcc1 subunit